ncbi:MAG: HNH endonuclease signature motif containing protein [Bacteroidota bacterium]
MPYKSGAPVYNETLWTDSMIRFLGENYMSKSNAELASALGLRLTTTRTKLYELGFKRMEMEYWTEEQILFLNENYKTVGDVELAEIFNQLYYKSKGWTKKHIEKKRRYLKLKRTEKQKNKIRDRNTAAGRFSINHWRRWIDRVSPVGEIRTWKRESGRPYKVIKTESGFVHYAQWLYVQNNGPVPEGMVVRLKDDDPLNVIPENLEIIHWSENALRNSGKASIGLSDNYVAGILTHNNPELRKKIKEYPELIEIKKQQLNLNRQLNGYGKK